MTAAQDSPAGRRLALAASVVVVATIAAAIAVMGTPAQQRQVRMDVRRTQDLAAITRAVQRHFKQRDALPADLASLAAQPGRRLAIVDRETGAPYEFAATGPHTFRVCARFALDSARRPRGWRDEDWDHGAGRQCFEQDAAAKEDD